jgi:branched-chain amino acid transport system substrate-binding protein
MNRCVLGVLIAAGALAATPSLARGQVTVYSSLPLQGASRPQTEAVVNGAKLALDESGGTAGGQAITYVSLDDSTAVAGNWTPEATAANALLAAQDGSAVAYIGEFNSGASEISLPILNEAGIAMISPGNTYTGLTIGGPGAEPGEPDKYYPTGVRTYFRLLPNDAVQASALAVAMHERGCRRVATLNDSTSYGAGLGARLRAAVKQAGMKLVATQKINRSAANYRALARFLHELRTDCMAFTGITADNAVQLFRDVAHALPKAKLFGSDGIAESAFADPHEGGVPASVGRRVTMSVDTLPPSAYPPAAADFFTRYRARFGGGTVDPYALYGYEAMRVVIDTMNASGASKAGLVAGLHAVQNRPSVLGTYGFDANGDTTLRTYGLYTIRDRRLHYAGAVPG